MRLTEESELTEYAEQRINNWIERDWTSEEFRNQTLMDFPNVVMWCATRFTVRKSINRKHTAYTLKHMLQRETGIQVKKELFSEAMKLCGYEEKEERFNISEKSPVLDEIKKGAWRQEGEAQ